LPYGKTGFGTFWICKSAFAELQVRVVKASSGTVPPPFWISFFVKPAMISRTRGKDNKKVPEIKIYAKKMHPWRPDYKKPLPCRQGFSIGRIFCNISWF